MKIHRAVALAIFPLAASTTLAAPDTTPKSRSDVRREAIAAQRAGETVVGDDPSYPNSHSKTTARPSKRKGKQASAPQLPTVGTERAK